MNVMQNTNLIIKIVISTPSILMFYCSMNVNQFWVLEWVNDFNYLILVVILIYLNNLISLKVEFSRRIKVGQIFHLDICSFTFLVIFKILLKKNYYTQIYFYNISIINNEKLFFEIYDIFVILDAMLTHIFLKKRRLNILFKLIYYSENT